MQSYPRTVPPSQIPSGYPPQYAYQQQIYPPHHPHNNQHNSGPPSHQQHLRRRTSSSTTYPRRLSSVSTATSNSNSNPNLAIGGGTSYVSTLRRQRATVWTSQTQFEDPRIIAARVAEKQRASSELGLSRNRGREGKILGVGEGMGSTNALTIPGVIDPPSRLAASEFDDDDDDDLRGDERSARDIRLSISGTSNSGGRDDRSIGGTTMGSNIIPGAHGVELATNANVRETEVDNSGLEMKVKRSSTRATQGRRGSLDEMEASRTLTMSGVRLFVANPD